MATAPSPNDLTRQQLDELDALLQRMLALPLNPPDGTPTAATPAPLPLPPDMVPGARNWRVDPPAPAPVPAPHVPLAPEAHSPRPEPAPAPWVPPEPERLAAPVSRVPPPEPEPAAPPAPKVVPLAPEKKKPAAPPRPAAAAPLPLPLPIPTPAPTPPAVPAPAAAPAPPGPPVPVALWPFVVLNWTTDRLLGLFGPPGWFLRGTFGKYLIGLTGIGLLLYTAAHLAQQYDWVSLPVPLPWPR